MKDNARTNLDAINILKGLAYSQLEVKYHRFSCKMKGRDLSILDISMRVKCSDRLIEKWLIKSIRKILSTFWEYIESPPMKENANTLFG